MKWIESYSDSTQIRTWVSGPYTITRYEYNTGSRKHQAVLTGNGLNNSYANVSDAKKAAKLINETP